MTTRPGRCGGYRHDMLARRLWPDGNVLGARIRAVPPRRGKVAAVDWTIVGIMANTRSYGSNYALDTRFYVPYARIRSRSSM